jgi:hypothetical protein
MKVISSRGLKPLSLFTLALSLAGCAVGPDYQAPKPAVPGSYNSLDSQEASKPQSAAINSRWWRSFNDPQLDSLIARAIEGNLTLQQAVLRIAGAREQLSQAQGGLFPSLNGSAKVNRQQLGLEGLLKANGATDQLDSNVASQLNGLTQAGHALSGQCSMPVGNSTCGAKCAVRLSPPMPSSRRRLSSASMRWCRWKRKWRVPGCKLRGAQSTIKTLQQQIDVAQQTTELTQSQQRNGLAPLTDVENARAQLSSLQAQLPQYQSQARQAMNGLAGLLGKTPGSLDAELSAPKALRRCRSLSRWGSLLRWRDVVLISVRRKRRCMHRRRRLAFPSRSCSPACH